MGSVVKGVFGGGGSKSSSSSGYSALTQDLQKAFNPLGVAVGQYTNPNNPGVINSFTPLAQTADETAAFNAMRQGFTPTASSLQADLSMLMNPFDSFVVDDINRQASGSYSILKQDLDAAGQLGSNRQMLGANDIEQTRLGTVGKLRQDQYNTALNQILTNLVPQRQQDAMNMLGIGDFARNLDTQTKQAPISALQAGTSMIAPFTAGGTDTSKTKAPGLFYTMMGNASGNL